MTVEPSRIQLQMMLVQQSGPGVLPLSVLPPVDGFIPFIRQMEQMAIEGRMRPIFVYWSRQNANRLLPTGKAYTELLRDAFCVSIFSENRSDPPDEWGFLMESNGLCLVVYGQQAFESKPGERYQCTGSCDPAIVNDAIVRLLPKWQRLDMNESNRLEEMRMELGLKGSAPPYMERVRQAWPIVKAPTQQGIILDPLQSLALPEADNYNQPSPTTGVSPVQSIAPPAQAGASPPPIGGVPPSPFQSLPSTGKVQPIAVDMGLQGMPNYHPGGGLSGAHAKSSASISSSRLTTLEPGAATRTKSSDQLLIQELDKAVTGLSNELPSVVPPAAQAIISDIISKLRHSSDLSPIFQYAIENLVKSAGADRGIIWRIDGEHLKVTHEFSTNGHNCFVDNKLTSVESSAIMLEFVSKFPDETSSGVISIPNTALDVNLHKVAPTLSSLIELGGVEARLMSQLKSRGKISGFLELQQCKGSREWSTHDAFVLQKIAELLSVVLQQAADQSRIEMDAQEMKLINEIAMLFRESRGMTTREALVKSIRLVAEHMGFTHSEIYLFNREENILEPQTEDSNLKSVNMESSDNPFVEVFKSGRGKMINVEYSRKPDTFFKHDMALVLPLTSEGSRLGVIGLWQRQANKAEFRTQDRELGLTIAGHLSNVIRADQAIQQIRADQARTALINRVSSEIRNALKRADQIMETLVEALQEFFKLELCVCALYDSQSDSYSKSKVASMSDLKKEGKKKKDDNSAIAGLEQNEDENLNVGDILIRALSSDLKIGATVFLDRTQINDILTEKGINSSIPFTSATLVPLFYGGVYKAALCLISPDQVRQLPEKDELMVLDLADRVAVVISHAELFAQTETASFTDPMTGLFNRRHFETQLGKEIDRYTRFGHPFSFIIVDLDYLKKINDTLGHHYGDEAIKHIGKVVQKSVRDVDTVARFGGEEFVVLLPETDLKAAKVVADRICTSIREKQVEGVGTITASLGVAVFPHDANDKDRLFELADKALYLSKTKGRNQVRTVTEDLFADGKELEIDMSVKLDADRYADAPKDKKEEAPKEAATIRPALPAFDLNAIAEKGILGLLAQVVKVVEEKDAYDSDRSQRVYKYANLMAQSLHLAKEHAEIVSLAAVLCNLGKMVVPEEILQKKEPLSEEEMKLVKQTPSVAAKFLEPAKLLFRVSQIIEACRENWDGSGYPNQMRGPDISVESQIVSLVDSYTAMTSDRPYHKAMSHEEAVKEIQAGSGKRWDSRLVKLFLSILQKDIEADAASNTEQTLEASSEQS
ncbi:MAG: diguanylate cyclase [Cyanobacteria bacterium TGS_CYA1]|nr:diguanylate cyclase [Cyanobacteria bacterium TGS_CYA1]